MSVGTAFAGTASIQPGRLPPEAIERNFADLHPPLTAFEARVASERCLYCHDAPCIAACPTGIDIPRFIREISTGNALPAAKTILESNIMGGMCARVCPTETLCEEACVRMESEGKPVQIGLLQRHATDALFAKGTQIFSRAASTGRKVAVVGAGPAGLACAHALARLGHDVTVLEARGKSGGLNEYGIAAYKALDEFAAREVAYILDVGGIHVEHGKRLGRDVDLAHLRERFHAVFLGAGLGGVNAPDIAHASAAGVEDAIAFIARLRQARDKSQVPVGRRVVVVGGGMTAIDMATQARRLGAEEVTIVYRRDARAMKASAYEQEVAQKDGVLLRHWLRPKTAIAPQGFVQAVAFAYVRDEGGVLQDTGETLTLACDQLFLAIGQAFLPADLGRDAPALEGGRIKVDAERRTSLANVWAGGDCIAGGSDLTVAAVEDGKRAARSIHASFAGA